MSSEEISDNEHADEAQQLIGAALLNGGPDAIVTALAAVVSAQLAVALETRLLAHETRLAAKVSLLGLGEILSVRSHNSLVKLISKEYGE